MVRIFLWVALVVAVVAWVVGLVGILAFPPLSGFPPSPPNVQVGFGVLAMFSGLCVFVLMVVHTAMAQK